MTHPTRRALTSVASAALLLLALTACGAGTDTSSGTAEEQAGAKQASEAAQAAPDLTGEWTQSNAQTDDSYQAATITGDAITVSWVSDGGATTSLYWAGSFEAPITNGAYSWDSQNDTTQTDGALLASGDPTKTFTYDNGTISYEVTALGTTTTVTLERADG